jgi:hypothetical protein
MKVLGLSAFECHCRARYEDRWIRTFQRRGQDWFCTSCAARPEPCSSCKQLRHVTFCDRDGRPRCGNCPDTDDITDPLIAIQETVAAVDPDLDPAVVVAAVHTVASRPAHQRKLARVITNRPELLTTGWFGCRNPTRASGYAADASRPCAPSRAHVAAQSVSPRRATAKASQSARTV